MCNHTKIGYVRGYSYCIICDTWYREKVKSWRDYNNVYKFYKKVKGLLKDK